MTNRGNLALRAEDPFDGGDDEGRPPWSEGIPPSGPLVRAVSLLDLELRTAVASVVAASAIPGTLLGRTGADHRDAARFYADLERSGRTGPELFVRPPRDLLVRVREVSRLNWAPGVSDVDLLSFESPYEVKYRPARERYLSHHRNRTARAMHWRHEDGPRPTIIVVHGFTGSPYWFNSNFFQLPWFYGHGCDVVLVVLPFHGRRNDRPAPYNGSGLFADGLATFNEAMFQSVCDLHVVIDYLESSGVEKVGITGLSLGGYVTALMAAVDPRLQFAIPNSAVTDISTLIDRWFPAAQVVNAGLRLGRVDRDLHTAALRLHSPLRHEVRLARDRLFIVGGLADRLAPPEQSARLWQHWGRPRLHWFPGSHILHLRRAVYLREIGRFLRDTGFSPG
jgi:pimeloyl-ACP methyl ester carboxylesterase